MIIDRLTLHNFGVYAGRQVLELTPPSPKTPVILIGGLNGGGKTTLLEALQLALYGRRSAPAVAFGGKYTDYLLSCISKGATPREGAAVELAFRVRRDGREHSHRVHRSWRRTGSGVKETLEVWCDGFLDDVLTEQWAERVEEILPSEVAPLFFFDGERIEQLADLERSADVLGTAIQSILGLDIVDKLIADLAVLERRHRTKSLSKEDRTRIEELEHALDRLQREHANLTLEFGQQQNAVDAAKRDAETASQVFRKAGGGLYAERASLEEKRATTKSAIDGIDHSLRTIAAGPAPLQLIRTLLEKTRDRASQEASHYAAVGLKRALEERDSQILSQLEGTDVTGEVVHHLREILAADRASRTVRPLTGRRLGLNHESVQRLTYLLGEGLTATTEQIRMLVAERAKVEEQLDSAERALADVPDEASLAQVAKDLNEAQQRLEVCRIRLEATILERSRLKREVEQAQNRLARELEKMGLDQLQQEDSARLVLHASRTRDIMRQFRTRVVEGHVRRIEDLVLDSFQQLLRKKSLVHRLEICPEEYSVTLRDTDGNVVLSGSLSAGERQLLAVSLLWGMARAASRPLPFVVDTPLGRLDSVHRTNLVTRYFPMASHQTLVLSTDEEIDETYYPMLSQHVGRRYLLDYDDTSRTTQVKEGYFFQ